MMLNPGESLNSHVTPVDVFFYLLQGEPDIEIGNERVRVSTNAARFFVVKLT